VVAVFEDRGHAEAAVDELWHAGFRHEQIGFVTPGGDVQEATTTTEGAEERGAHGAATGAVAGTAVGALAGGLATALIPGIGPVLAGGIFTGVILGGAAGAAAGSYLGPFIALDLPEDEARHYAEQLKSGRTIVTVKAGDDRDRALEILRSHGGQSANLPQAQAAGRP
jgi:hypothetical protein